MQLYYAAADYRGQKMYVFGNQSGVVFVGTPGASPEEVKIQLKHCDISPSSSCLVSPIQQLTEYFQGERRTFDISREIITGTALQKQVWHELNTIPYGETISYSDLAARVGKPKAIRAVATAVAKNPLMIFNPCHRVIRQSGAIGNYRGGVQMKRTLLSLERGHQ
ncbi:methylated-DNA--[protein]-cysteine S-methyltransferase [Agrilactobacillus fermenti]|uniref:methylated-DNA--[protein]-cysteine S-methyltransferase n=1 Tax=Agrilactobacillus fermenti TaxID=2586909 RepID=UPI001E5BD7CE|nr:methylated-DNA--[protein]-cysteine S-methyltransferase [Agrilactobacillus fermenti]MCD2255605.1 methylated-DNA--[protein]-cysteine S-methyltransferase [Agrilactobacillus fermenti]